MWKLQKTYQVDLWAEDILLHIPKVQKTLVVWVLSCDLLTKREILNTTSFSLEHAGWGYHTYDWCSKSSTSKVKQTGDMWTTSTRRTTPWQRVFLTEEFKQQLRQIKSNEKKNKAFFLEVNSKAGNEFARRPSSTETNLSHIKNKIFKWRKMLCCYGGAVSDAITLPCKEEHLFRETKSEEMMSVPLVQFMKCHSCRGDHLHQMALVPKWKEAGKRKEIRMGPFSGLSINWQ